jgi:predicted small metal-binding protein
MVMDVVRQFTNRCACGWEFRGTRDDVVDATIDHGARIHNMAATRDEVLAALDDGDADAVDPGGPGEPGSGAADPPSAAARR